MKFNLKSNIILTFSLLALMPSLAFSESVIVGAAVPPPPQKKIGSPNKQLLENKSVIATINGRVITASEIRQAIENSTPDSGAIIVKNDRKLLKSFVENYINEILIVSDSKVQNLARREDIKAKLDYAQRSTLVKAWLAEIFSDAALKGDLKDLAIQSSRSGEFNRFKIQQIQISDQAKAMAVLAKVAQHPKLFDDEVGASEAPSSQAKGLLGWIKKTDLPAEFGPALDELKDGEIYSQLIQTKFGFHVIRLAKSQKYSADDILDDFSMRQKLAERLVAEVRQKKLDSFHSKSKIQFFEENLRTIGE